MAAVNLRAVPGRHARRGERPSGFQWERYW